MESTESTTLKNCVTELELSIKINLKDIATFLHKRNILLKDTYNSVTGNKSMLTSQEKACEVLDVLRNKVEEDKDVYKMFMEYLLTKPQYRVIAKTLEKEYASLDTEAAPKKSPSDHSNEASPPTETKSASRRSTSGLVFNKIIPEESKIFEFCSINKENGTNPARFSVWLDTAGIHSGSEWPAALGIALNNCKAIIPVITKKFTTSRFCKKELNKASQEKLMFPVFFEDVDLSANESQWLSFSITDIQWTNFRPDTDYNVSLGKLVAGLKNQGLGRGSDTVEVAGNPPNQTSAPASTCSAASRSTSGLDSMPSMAQLEELKTKNGEVVKFIQDVSCDWERMGISFNFDDMGNTVDRIQREKTLQGMEACLREVMRLWLKRSTDENPSTWRKLIDVLYNIQLSYLAQKLENHFK